MAQVTSAVDTSGLTIRNGLATLGPQALALRCALDARFERWGRQNGAQPMSYPPLLAVADLARIDYFANFPHLALLASGLNTDALDARYPGDIRPTMLDNAHLTPARYVLPPAACHGVYADLAGSRLAGGPHRVTTVATCFRREHYLDGVHRLLGFTMREIVCVGDRDSVLTHLAHYRRLLLDYLAELGLPVGVQPGSDPFFDATGPRALVQQLFPAKEEFVYGDSLAIASVNFHRNVFGERCDIRTSDGAPAFSGCVAFGLERWIGALGDHFGEEPAALLKRIADIS
jgi:hypothetical protein